MEQNDAGIPNGTEQRRLGPETRPGGRGLGGSRCKLGTISFPLALKEVGLQIM